MKLQPNNAVLVFGFWVSVVLLAGCVSSPNQPVLQLNAVVDLNSSESRQSLQPWYGEYLGVLPCDDCEGVETRLKLMPEGNYELRLNYLGKSRTELNELGSFLWDNHSQTVILGSDPSTGARFKPELGKLLQTDVVGTPMVSKSSNKYELLKIK